MYHFHFFPSRLIFPALVTFALLLGLQAPAYGQVTTTTGGVSTGGTGLTGGVGISGGIGGGFGAGAGLTGGGASTISQLGNSFVGQLNGQNVYGVSQINPWRNYYVNPYTMGLNMPQRNSSGTTNMLSQQSANSASFGQPRYGTSTATGGGGVGGFGGGARTSSGGLGAGGGTRSSSGGFGGSSIGGGTTFGGATSRLGGTSTSTRGGFTGGAGSSLGGAGGRGTGGFGTTTGGRSAGVGAGLTGTGGGFTQGGLTGGIQGGAGQFGGFGASGLGAGSFSTVGQLRTSPYVAAPGYTVPRQTAPTGRLRNTVQSTLQNSTRLSTQNIQANVSGRTVILRGNVQSPRERRVAEALIRLTPGVRSVQNDLKVRAR